MLLTDTQALTEWLAKGTMRAYYFRTLTPFQIETALEQNSAGWRGLAGREDRPANYVCGVGKKMRVLSPSEKWVPHCQGAIPKEIGPEETDQRLQDIYGEAMRLGLAGLNGLPSPGSIAKGQMLKTTSCYKEGALGPARALAYRAIHQGPMTFSVAMLKDAHLYDRSGAFLHGLGAKIPLGLHPMICEVRAGGIVGPGGIPTDFKGSTLASDHTALLDRTLQGSAVGFCEAEVHQFGSGFPTLPFEARFQNSITPLYAHGTGRGVWTLEHLRAELQAKRIEIIRVINLYVAVRSVAIYERARDFFSKIVQEYKPLGKALYLTAWGNLAQNGHGITFTPFHPADTDDACKGIREAQTEARRLQELLHGATDKKFIKDLEVQIDVQKDAWRNWDAGQTKARSDYTLDNGGKVSRIWSHKWWAVRPARPDCWEPQGTLCRPEHAAEIAGSNSVAVSKMVADIELNGGTVAACLTDSLLVNGEIQKAGWKLEAGGYGAIARNYGVGNGYISMSGDMVRYRAMGCLQPTDLSIVQKHWASCRPDHTRRWNGNPVSEESAVSVPKEIQRASWARDYPDDALACAPENE